ncbi:MAG: glycosyltransferase family 4 protein [Anaerolineae bacterium]|nr:glycosyltransferase family 4 protein [Gloeobacterales cyanobacterium ES-bin-313]
MKVCLYGVFPEEKRLSMELCGQYLEQGLRCENLAEVKLHVPAFHRYLETFSKSPALKKIDVLINRHFTYELPDRKKFDVHHVVDHSYGHLVHRLPLERTVVTCHDLNIYERMQRDRSLPFQAMCRHILGGLNKARWIICDSQFTAEALAKSELAKGAQVTVVHLGLASNFQVLPTENLLSISKRFRLPDAPKVIHVGDCFDRKNIEVLLMAVHRLKIHLVKVGGQFSESQQKLIKDFNLDSQITHLHGVNIEDLVGLYNLADLCIFPSWLEGFGFPVLEAMACGTPVVASNRSSVPELVGGAGLLADPADAEAFVAQSLRVLNDQGVRENLIEKGLQRVQQFTWANHARQVCAFYDRVLESIR